MTDLQAVATGSPAPRLPLPSSALSFLWLEITERCNLECTHCYADSSPARPLLGSMRLGDWVAVIDQAATLGCRQVQFIGGEPTLHPDLLTLLAVASQRHFSVIEIFTNLTVVTDQLLSACRAHGVSLATSFYSSDPEVHDNITQRVGSFARTVDGIRRATARGIAVRAGMIDTIGDREHLQATRTVLEELGITEIRVDRPRAIGRARPLLQPPDPWTELCGRCSSGTLCVTATGGLYPCVMSRFAPLGHIDQGLPAVLSSSALDRFQHTLRQQAEIHAESPRCSPRLACEPTCSPTIMCIPADEQPCAPDREDERN